METALTGSCQCGAVELSITAPALFTYACFCTSCQKRTGSAFSMGLIVPVAALHTEGELTSWSRTAETGQINTRYSCAECGNIIYGVDNTGMDMAKVQAGLLDDTSNLEPEIYLFNRSRQPWIRLPERAQPYATQPDDVTELLTRVQAYREGR